MHLDLILMNLTTPPILFFILGIIAYFVKSDFELPQPILKFLSYYLLFSIGYKGGVALSETVFSSKEILTIIAGLIASSCIPLIVFFIVKRKFSISDSAAIAASYGSVSAVTFITTTSFLTTLGISFGGQMVGMLALMEFPAIIVGLTLYKFYKNTKDPHGNEDIKFSMKTVLHEAFFNGCVLILMGSLCIGYICACKKSLMDPFVRDIFYGMLSFYLLDLGIMVGQRLGIFKKHGVFAILFGILFPVTAGILGLYCAKFLGLEVGNALLLAVLFASPSYIAVPAVFRVAVPDANPSVFVSLALGVTFPFNIIIGIPLYYQILNWIN